jgi:hypothetical protein
MSLTKQLRHLSPAQEQQLQVLQDKWLAIGLSTQPADRGCAEAGVRLAYRAANLGPPVHLVWFESPLAGALATSWFARGLGSSTPRGSLRRIKDQVKAQVAALVADGVGYQVGEPVRDRVRDQVLARIGHRLRRQVGKNAWPLVGARIWSALDRELRPLNESIISQLTSQLRSQVAALAQLRHCAAGQFDASWVGLYESFHALHLTAVTEELAGICMLTQSCGWWWPFSGLCILTERPTSLARDDEGRLHNASGPALTYPDGWSIFAFHGVRVGEAVIRRPESITVRQIQRESNAEIRRVLLDKYGFDRFVLDGGGQRIHTDSFGTLYRCELPGEEPGLIVCVTNSTPEADGTHKRYLLRVPPSITTAREAVAWTFGMSEQDYSPTIET